MAKSHRQLSEQVIVITGASSGIGLATVWAAARKGAKVTLAARSMKTLNRITEQIAEAGGDAMAVECDVACREQVDLVTRRTIERFGRIDTWVNCAGLGLYGRLDEVREEDSRRLFDVNFWGVVNGSLSALPELRRSGGTLINVGSELSEAYTPLLGMYTASKHAVKGFTDSLRVEVEQVDAAPVTVTLIQPTAVNTPFPENARNCMEREAQLPGPTITPEKVADAILRAATQPTRAKRVGMKAKLNATVATLAPAVADRHLANMPEKLQGDEPPRNPQGILYAASEEAGIAGRIRGTDRAGKPST